MKAGILYPRSKAHPGMMVDFVDGIKLALNYYQLNHDIELITESIGFGGHEKEVYEKAEKLLELEGADIIVAYIDLRVIPILEPLIQSSGKLMIVVNSGANYPENWAPQANIIYLTLQHSFLCWLSGALAAGNNNPGAAVATSFYDGGYLHIAALSKSFASNGGHILHNHVNNGLYNETFEIKALTDFLAANKEVHKLLCVFDSAPAALFYDRLNKYDDSSRLQLYVSPMMLEQPAWQNNENGYNFLIKGHLPYHAAAESDANTQFRNVFTAQSKREPSIFALQGWETSLVLREIILNCKDNYTDGVFVADHLATVTIDSPRGTLNLDSETAYFIAPAYKGVIKNNSKELIITPAEKTDQEWQNFVGDPITGPSSGWTNTYLCY
jgi:branched-chain amino acid transport system substrate-binding protein